MTCREAEELADVCWQIQMNTAGAEQFEGTPAQKIQRTYDLLMERWNRESQEVTTLRASLEREQAENVRLREILSKAPHGATCNYQYWGRDCNCWQKEIPAL